MKKELECFDKVYINATLLAPDFEIWPGYYKRRYQEFLNYYKVFPHNKFDSILEVGCGIGYQSALMACIGGEVTASDVDKKDNIKHSRGLELANGFISSLDIKNVKICDAGAEDLPFRNQQFDLVFCSYSFQYINDKTRALSEIGRVLKPGAYFFCIVPSVSDRLEALISYYWSFLKSIFSGKRSNNVPVLNKDNTQKVHKNRTFFSKLLPPPDDGESNFFEELYGRRRKSWEKVFAGQSFSIELIRPTACLKNEGRRFKRIKNLWGSVRSSGIVYLLKKI